MVNKRFFALHLSAVLPFIGECLALFKNGNFIRGIISYWKDYFHYKKLHAKNSKFPLQLHNTYPRYFDRYEPAGIVPKHYFHMDIWAAKKIYESKVKEHFDIGSRIDGFIAHCVVFCQVVMLDIRELPYTIPGLRFVKADCSDMSHIKSNTIPSISSLHALEHFGLGRYGDPIDPDQYHSAMKEIQRVTKKNGNIYIAVPIGKERVEFNAHRIFNPKTIVSIFSECTLVEFSAIDDNDIFHTNVNIKLYGNAHYSCGMFHFKKN